MEIKKETVEVQMLYLQCIECGRKIYSRSASQLVYNFKVHMKRKHPSIPEVEKIIYEASKGEK